jgi:SAM-dependent methyltransferase
VLAEAAREYAATLVGVAFALSGTRPSMDELFELPYSPTWDYDERYFLDNEHRYTRMHALLRERYGELSGRRVADIGCCRGQFLSRLQSYHDIELTGIEIEDEERALAEARGIDADEHYINVFDGQTMVARLPFADEAVDIVVAGEVLEHLVDTAGFVREVRRVLKPEGALVLSTPNLLWWKYRLTMLLGRYPDCLEHKRYWREDFGHVRIFSAERLRSLLEEAGLADVHIVGNRLGPLASLTRTPRRVAHALDRLAERTPTLSNDLIAFARKPRTRTRARNRRAATIREST